MALGDKLLDAGYTPTIISPEGSRNSSGIEMPHYSGKIVKCPVKFTSDPFEFLTGSEFMDGELTPVQATIIEDMYNTFLDDEHKKPKFTECVVLCGMRSGKSVIASLACAFQTQLLLAMDDPAAQLGQMAGYQLTAQFVATSEMQSKQTAYAAFNASILSNKWWKAYIGYLQDREINEGREKLYRWAERHIFFREKNVIIKSLHSNSASLAGMTSYFVAFDEMSRFKVSENTIPTESETSCAQAVYSTSSNSTLSLIPFSRIFTVTSPLYELDYGMQLLYRAKEVRAGRNAELTRALRRKYPPTSGKHVERMVGYHFETVEFNPKRFNKHGVETGVAEEDLESYKANMVEFNRNFRAIPPGSENPYFEHPERIDYCIAPLQNNIKFVDKIVDDVVLIDGKTEVRSYVAKDIYLDTGDKSKRYFICCDQGEKHCKFVVCMGHIEEYLKDPLNPDIIDYRILIDFIESWIPDSTKQITVSFPNVEEVIKVLAQRYNLIKVTYDQWQSVESLQRLFNAGINSTRLEINKKMYDEFKRLVYEGKVALPNDPALITELRQLNLVRGTSVQKPAGGSKDAADAICRVVYACYGDYLESILPNPDARIGRLVHMPNVKDIYAKLKAEEERQLNVGKGNFSNLYNQYKIFGDSGSNGTYVGCNLPGGHKGRKNAFNLDRALSNKKR